VLFNILNQGLRTLVDCPDMARFSILAFKGITVERDRESLLSGSNDRAQQGRKNINGSNVFILDSFEDGGTFWSAMTDLGCLA